MNESTSNLITVLIFSGLISVAVYLVLTESHKQKSVSDAIEQGRAKPNNRIEATKPLV